MKTILILGASRYYIKNIEAAKRAGYRVIAIDQNSNAEGLKSADIGIVCDIKDCDGIIAICREYSVSAVVPLNDYGVISAAKVSGMLGLLGISEQSSIYSTNKELMRAKWIEKGVPCPKLEIGRSLNEIVESIASVGLPCVLKPAHGVGGGSRGVIVISDENEIQPSIDFSIGFYEDKTTLIESFIEADSEHSAEVLIYNKEAYILAIADKVKTELPYRVDKKVVYPSALQNEDLIEAISMIKSSVLALGIEIGAAHVEFAKTKSGYYLFELGARCGGGGTAEPIVPYVTGIEQFVEFVKILAGDEPNNLVPFQNQGCVYNFIVPDPGTVLEINGFDEIKANEHVLDAELFIQQGDYIAPTRTGADRSGFIIVAGKDRDDAMDNCALVENKLNIRYVAT